MPPNQHQQVAHAPAPRPRRKHIDWAARTVRIELFIVLVGSALLLSTVSLYLALNGTPNAELNKVDKTKYQAVFLNGGIDFTTGTGQPITYFGKLTRVNDKYMVLRDVYFFTPTATDSSGGNQGTQLVKLGCQQLHSPFDEMVINRNQVAFWENLQDSGKVVQAIKEFQKQNPQGPDCSQQPTTSPSPTPPPATPPTTPPSNNNE